MKEEDATVETRGRKAPRLRYWETHGGKSDPSQIIRQGYFEEIEADEVVKLSKEAQIPYSTFRGAGSFYSDLKRKRDHSCVKVCNGTSCFLSGTQREVENLCRSGHDCEFVSCLGHCDRSPVSLDDCTVQHADLTSEIRCVAPTPVVTKRILKGSVAKIERTLEAGIYSELPKALSHSPIELIELMERSGLRGRGGAGYPVGQKWKAAASFESDRKFVIANGDEGDPGCFIDRVLMEEDPHTILEGMILCAYATGATEGIVYIRSEYPYAATIMDQAIRDARDAGFLGTDICGSGFDFDVRIFVGMGSYVCGEETALIQSIEGFRGEVQLRPPYPTEFGLYGKPTVVNNVETLANVPFIVNNGSDAYLKMGTHASSGTKAICLNAGFKEPGIVEAEYGITLREVIEEIGGGSRDGNPLAAVLIGGPMGSIVLPKDWDLPLCYEVLARHDIEMGHAGIIAIPRDTDFKGLLNHLIEFSVGESCGKCVPCRLGTQCLHDALHEGKNAEDLLDISNTIKLGSLCAFGKYIPGPINTLIREFGDQIF